MKRIAILGSTGSIGTQTLSVIRSLPGKFEVVALTTHHNTALLEKQAAEFKPKFFGGPELIENIIAESNADIIVNAIVGFAGLEATYRAVQAGKTIALANKESLVVAGELLMDEAKRAGAKIIPIDSEHSAIFQCIQGGNSGAQIKKVTLTGSGGPFRGMKKDVLRSVTPEQALKHPTWTMGKKISIDSATLINKGLEIIEARWLFNLRPEQIEVIIHPQSIVHSFVEFIDGSTLAQMGKPSMLGPIQYALTYPGRIQTTIIPALELASMSSLTFEQPDLETFPSISLAREALRIGGTMPTVLNAANEVAVERFLGGNCAFLEIPEIVEKAMQRHTSLPNPTYDAIVATDTETRATL